MLILDPRYRVDAFASFLEEHEREARKRKLRALGLYFGLVWVGSIALTVLVHEAWPFSLFWFLFGSVIFLGISSKRSYASAKVRFAQELYGALRDELDPRSMIACELDARPYDARGKLVRERRSAAGHSKYVYRDRWLNWAALLADGTGLTLSCDAKVKTKKGSITSQGHRAVVELTARPRRYRLDELLVNELVKKRLTTLVENTKGFGRLKHRVRAWAGPSEPTFRIVISNDEAPVAIGAVLAAFDGALRTLGPLARPHEKGN